MNFPRSSLRDQIFKYIMIVSTGKGIIMANKLYHKIKLTIIIILLKLKNFHKLIMVLVGNPLGYL